MRLKMLTVASAVTLSLTLADARYHLLSVTGVSLEDVSGRKMQLIRNNQGHTASVVFFSPPTPASTPPTSISLISITRNGSDIVVTFQAVQGATYRLERKLALTDANWSTISGVNDLTAASNGPAQLTDPGGAFLGKAFYRVMLPKQFNCDALCFIERYSSDGSVAPSPASGDRGISTPLRKVDIGFVVDTTFSMNGEVANLKTSLSTIFDTLSTRVPNLGIGIAGHDDVPTAKYVQCGPAPFFTCPSGFTCVSYGTAGNWCTPNAHDYGNCDNTVALFAGNGFAPSDDPYYQLTAVTTDSTTAVNAVNNLHQGNGEDIPQGQVLALDYAVTGNAFSWPALNQCPAGSRPAVAETSTNFGALGFRKDALPLLIEISDAEFHNGVPVSSGSSLPSPNSAACIYNPGASTCSSFTYSTEENYIMTEPTISDLATALKSRGVRFLGGAADDSRAARIGTTTYVSGPSAGVTGTSAARNPNWEFGAYGDMAYLADQTSSLVPPSAFIHSASCPDGQCCTGFNGAGVAPDGPGGTCRLVFNVNHDGTGLGQQIIDSVDALLNAIKFDVYVQAYNDAAESTDVVTNFMLKVEPDTAGGTDPITGEVCVSFPASQLADNFTGPKALIVGPDGVYDTITQINPSLPCCFKVTAKPNTVVTQTTTEQTFHAWLRVLAIKPDGTTIPLGPDRDIYFVVPPVGY